MRRFRLSISGILVIVAATAFVLGSVRVGSPGWAGLLTSLTFFMLVASLMGIVLRQGSRRVYWVGFAVMGWFYIGTSTTYWFGLQSSGARIDAGRYFLAPQFVPYFYDILHTKEGVGYEERVSNSGGMGGFGGGMGGMGGGMRSMVVNSGPPTPPIPPGVEPIPFMRIVRCLEALLWAFLGGWTARYFASGRASASVPPRS